MKSYHILYISCNWILSLRIMFKILPCCSMYQFLHSFLWSNNNPLFRDISFCLYIHHLMEGFPSDAGDARGASLIPGAGRSPGEGNGNPFQYSCLENPRDRGAWWAAVHRVTKSRTWLKQISRHAHISFIKIQTFRSIYLVGLCLLNLRPIYLISWWIAPGRHTKVPSAQSVSRVWLFSTPWTAAHQVPWDSPGKKY